VQKATFHDAQNQFKVKLDFIPVGRKYPLLGRVMKMDISPWRIIDMNGRDKGTYYPTEFIPELDDRTIPPMHITRLGGFDNGFDGVVKYRGFQLNDNNVFHHAHGMPGPYVLTFAKWIPNCQMVKEPFIGKDETQEIYKNFPKLKPILYNRELQLQMVAEGMEQAWGQEQAIYNANAEMSRLLGLVRAKNMPELRDVMSGFMKLKEDLGRAVQTREETEWA
jgi:hypothetical protein